MANGASLSPWRLMISARDPRIVRAATEAADGLIVPYTVIGPNQIRGTGDSESRTQLGTVYCLDCRLALELEVVPGPCIVVCGGLQVRDEALIPLASTKVVPIQLRDLSARTLLGCLFQLATHNHAAAATPEEILMAPELARVPRALLDAFLCAPSRVHTLDDIAGVLGLSKARARQTVHRIGFSDPRHLTTAIRARAWTTLVGTGMERGVVERYLGIPDRSTFRRSCRNAGVPVPWAASGSS